MDGKLESGCLPVKCAGKMVKQTWTQLKLVLVFATVCSLALTLMVTILVWKMDSMLSSIWPF